MNLASATDQQLAQEIERRHAAWIAAADAICALAVDEDEAFSDICERLGSVHPVCVAHEEACAAWIDAGAEGRRRSGIPRRGRAAA
jgi:2-methylisocitrate lyase-like PEP mutase family enzyme